jgi:NHL repeat
MSIPSRPKYVVSGIVVPVLLAACSGGGAGAPAPGVAFSQQVSQNASVLRPGVPQLHSNVPATAFASKAGKFKGRESIVVSDASNDVVDIFNSAGTLTATLTGFSQPQGLALDSEGNLYVADTNNSRIQVYAAGFNGKPTTIDDAGEAPVGVAIDSQDNIAVTNIISTSDGPGSVSFFSKGGTLLATLSNANFAKVLFDAFDRKGNLYIDGINGSGDFVAGEIVGGVSGDAITVLTTGNTVGYPGGVAVTSAGKIVVDDQKNVAIYTYNAPVKGSLGTPIATTPLTGAGDPISIAFTRKDKGIWVADPASGGAADKALVSSADKYQYTTGGGSTRDILFSHGSQPTGIVLGR